MKKLIVSALGLILSFYSFGQEYISITGKVMDASDKKPITYATVSVLNRPIGVVTNDEGVFEMSIPMTSIGDSLSVSNVGYAKCQLLISEELDGANLEFRLEKKAIMLPEIVVTEKELTATEIVKLAIGNIKQNYPQKPYSMDAFYRDYKIEDGLCVGLFEAAFSIYDKGYKRRGVDELQEHVELKHVRKSVAAEFKTNVFNSFNILGELLKVNDVRYRRRSLDIKDQKYIMNRIDIIGDRTVYVIETDDRWKFFLYIDVETYAFIKIELDAQYDEEHFHRWQVGDTINNDQYFVKSTLEFQKYGGVYYPKFHSFHSKVHVSDVETGDHLFDSEFQQMYLINNILTDEVVKPEKDNRMNKYLTLEQQDVPYDEEFWRNYNMIKMNPLDEKLVGELEDRLGSQF